MGRHVGFPGDHMVLCDPNVLELEVVGEGWSVISLALRREAYW